MKRLRRLAWIGVAVGVVALAFGVRERVLWRPGVTEANARRIREGMSREEVEAVFGKRSDWPPHDWAPAHRRDQPFHTWDGEKGYAKVSFKNKGLPDCDKGVVDSARAEWISYTKRGGSPLGFFDRLRAFFGW